MNKLLVENILRRPMGFEWSVQGLGQMRLYLAPQIRLHVWDRSLLVPGVSAMHTHPWDFKSTVIAGRVWNRRFLPGSGEEFNRVRIQCGENASMVGEPEKVRLFAEPFEQISEQGWYVQRAEEIHLSAPEDGTVTIIERTPKADADHAFVYWRGRGGWVDATPRPATPREIESVTSRALGTWF